VVSPIISSDLNPAYRALVVKGLDAASTLVGSNSSNGNSLVTALLNAVGGSIHLDYSIGIGDYQVAPGVKVALTLELAMSINTDHHYIDFVVTPKAAASFQLDSAFGSLSSLINTLAQYGVTVTPTITLSGSVEFWVYYQADGSNPAGKVAVQTVSIELKPQVVIQGEWLKAILAVVCPAAESVVSAIASVIKTLTGYDLMQILTSTITITIDIKDTYNVVLNQDTLFMSLMVNVVAIQLNLPLSLGNFEAGGVGYVWGQWQSVGGWTYGGYVYVFYDYKLAGHSGSGKYYLTQF
ncbi:MAG TPA: hypothetical protein VKK79_21105, partial [Candidatus Lokiarchaeia archaeon]|nr:hypothetical protein [Candidatus Lokiarchaeia archaeon]